MTYLEVYAASQPTPTQGTGWRRHYPAPFGRFDALRRSGRRVGCMPACRHLGSLARAGRRPGLRRPARQRLLHAVRRLGASRQRHPHDARADPRRPEGHRALHPHGPHLFRRPAAPSWCRRSPTNSACALRSAPGSTRTTRRNEREMRSVIDLARRGRNIDSIVVGNETIFRGEQTVDELIKMIQRVKRETSVPVTTGEIWHAWIEHPELASAVDFIAAHVLPYWEGISEKAAVDQAIHIYNTLRQAYPGKRIVIAEFGWPSAGYNRRDAYPGPDGAGRGAARLRQPRRSARHRLQHHRSLRPAVEDLRRRRRPLLGHVRHLARSRSSPGPARSPIPTTGSSPASRC